MSTIMENQTTTYLSFRIGNELFGIQVTGVREVLELPSITPVPRTPDFMKGVINLRGEVVPILDLRQKLGAKNLSASVDTSIIVIEQSGEEDESLTFGALVDSVEEVFDLNSDTIEAPPSMGLFFDTAFLDGVGKRGEEFAMLLNLRQVFADAVIPQLNAAS